MQERFVSRLTERAVVIRQERVPLIVRLGEGRNARRRIRLRQATRLWQCAILVVPAVEPRAVASHEVAVAAARSRRCVEFNRREVAVDVRSACRTTTFANNLRKRGGS